ncbi:hypothetical protein PPL_10919 [Heterostelium album PN500]|uniref:Uncharacterized protein n=1 Tax=Heterostelium pallidum (strain ATCC 26659 / Pp 5 / PN500) TaxID=670386 RepID=D3BSF2_HETP5|nr:hypothetical protein PPL_10919 [Heterostelium album PN500]EFA75658.1 hypothetical protein PPL_10919 [Heterostelium album PN500]|eukprot:XP_020427792.1 hypothetical protein PPL_10919 [Heterostelium album PN500]
MKLPCDGDIVEQVVGVRYAVHGEGQLSIRIYSNNVPIIKYLLQNTSEHLTTEYSQLTHCKAFDYSPRLKLINYIIFN